MINIQAPNQYDAHKFTIFLAGSIEMGKADNWQQRVVVQLQHLDIQILNPRRDDWDCSWLQSKDHPRFYQQVNWELDGLLNSDLVVFVFDPTTQSPITLLELGICSRFNKPIIVYCPDGFWRKGNVDIVCEYFNITQVTTEQELIDSCTYFFHRLNN